MVETRALLLTDLVDSTKLSAQLGDTSIAALWAAHDTVARDLLVPHHGREIDKTDGFLLLFDAAPNAVAYALAYHRALRTLDPPLQARVGLHVGDVILTHNAPEVVARGAKPLEVDGVAKPTAARVMSVASGGQTLLTEAACRSLGRTTLRLESHGHWRMKGIAEPIELFEVGDADAPFTPPPDGAKVYRVVEQGDLWLPVKEVKHSLPAERDAFVGRQADLTTLARRLDGDARLVSVLGIGGTGKTRLVTRYGWRWLGDYPGGVWFCDLSEARGVDGIAYAVARALDVPLGKGEPIAQLGHAIAGRGRCLVLLDNFEQVARHAEQTVGQWLDRAAEAQFVVTTREVLGLPGEETLALAPLPTSEGAALFVARARSAKRDFQPADMASIDALVTLLDGLPLAIELAAARVRLMPPAKLLERMSQRFKLLTSSGGRRDRHATLQATLDWSWELLSADEQAALAQVSVFEGGFTLEAAEAVLELDEAWPMDAVQALVDKSLVRVVADDRFDLLVSVQEYAAGKLDKAGGRRAAQTRHGAHFATFGSDQAVESLDVHGGVARRVALGRELDNLVAGCSRAVQRSEGPTAVALLSAACAVMELRGPYNAAVALALRVVGLPGLSPREGAVAQWVLGGALHLAGRGNEARAHLDAGRALAREVGDRRTEGRALGDLGLLHTNQGRMDDARTHYEAALAVARESGDRRYEGVVLGELGNLHSEQGQVDQARVRHDAALAVHREVGDRRAEGRELGNLGVLHALQGRMDEARALFDTALAVTREVGDRRYEGVVLCNLGLLHSHHSRMDEAHALFEAALAVAREVGDRREEGVVLGNMSVLRQSQGRMDEAHGLFNAALTVHREVGNRSAEGRELGNLGTLNAQQGRMDEARALFDAALAVHREVGNRRAEGDTLGNLGDLHQLQGRMDEARAHFDAALAVIREIGDRRAEGVALRALGTLHLKLGRLDEARAHYDEALAASREVGNPLDEGVALGDLGNLHLLRSELADAKACVQQGERLLREVRDPTQLGHLLCVRAHIEGARGDLEAARTTLEEVETLDVAGTDSGLGQRLAEARLAIEAL